MREFEKILKQNAFMAVGIINLIESLEKNIDDLTTKYTYVGKNVDIKVLREYKTYLEEVLKEAFEVGKSFNNR